MISRLDLGSLEPFHTAGVLEVPDVQTAVALLRISGQPAGGPEVGLAVGLCVRALRSGSVCIDLDSDPGTWTSETQEAAELQWPTPPAWREALAASTLVAVGEDATRDRPLRMVGSLVYLQRYWCDEQLIRQAMRDRARPVAVAPEPLAAGLRRLFPEAGPDMQRLAAATAALRQATIIAGGPGTGKTTTVARLLALLRDVDPAVRSIALAAPTGKAAVRLEQAVGAALADLDPQDRRRLGSLSASTLHRLLGWRPDSTGRFRHDRSNPLPQDVVVVDETSMVSLPMMARLLEAVRPDARVILVGDPDQLASIEAGAVLGDLVAAPAGTADSDLATALGDVCPSEAPEVVRAAATGVVVLDRNYRFGGAIADLAAAIRRGDIDEVLRILRAGHADVEFLDPDLPGTAEIVHQDVVAQAAAVHASALEGSAADALSALDAHRVLCAHRSGPFGVSHWDDLIAQWTRPVYGATASGHWFAGQPLLVTANDYTRDLYNGDTGVVVRGPDATLRAAFSRSDDVLELPLSRLDAVQTLRAMTIHRGQGSQFTSATVILPPEDSALLTRELLYTAVTRAKKRVRILGTEAGVRAGVQRQVRRASGLRDVKHLT